jgi:bifunctional non-homologous end joining protein LigD
MDSFPSLIRPMLAKLAHTLPEDQGRYGWEMKWDGMRAVAYIADGDIQLLSRNNLDITGRFPELQRIASTLRPSAARAVLDGEIVAAKSGQPDFAALQRRIHVGRPPPHLIAEVPVSYYVFDVLYLRNHLLTREPYTHRRSLLEGLRLQNNPVVTPPWWHDSAAEVMAASREHGLEGVVGKPLNSHYRPGNRTLWIKVKNVRHQDVVIAGWKPGKGSRGTLIGSLLVGVYDDAGRLCYAGHVGTGFTHRMLHDLTSRLAPLRRADSPFSSPVPNHHARGVQWVEPQLVGEVMFTEWTGDPGVLRHPSWRGLRDKPPREARREDLTLDHRAGTINQPEPELQRA